MMFAHVYELLYTEILGTIDMRMRRVVVVEWDYVQAETIS